ncbi:MAG: DNA-processing protein DprA [Candidatus Paracaedibacteraceae bacterium]|nr:DNA-processing protein DprA [Candidatus Paracaedibacteraceae bacterium]
MTIFNKKRANLELWLSILRSPGIGAKKFWHLYAKDPLFRDVRTIDVKDEISYHEKLKFGLCAGNDDDYPERLHNLNDAPPIFSYAGDISLLQTPCIGIVGARNASPGGKKLTFQIAQELGKAGFTIVSGMARGIDGAAHEGSLETGTIAVLASGLDVLYPPEHKTLYEQLCNPQQQNIKGCIISEMPLGTAPAAPLFPRRNRIIAALCDGLVVIEAAAKSGTLITAIQAIELGRDVFVIPGSPLDPRSRGGNSLIKQGAILVESAEDILAHYVDNKPRLRKSLEEKPTKQHQKKIILPEINTEESQNIKEKRSIAPLTKTSSEHEWFNCLGLDPISVEEIMAQNKQLTAQQLFAALAHLEMDGVIIRFPDGRVAKVFK